MLYIIIICLILIICLSYYLNQIYFEKFDNTSTDIRILAKNKLKLYNPDEYNKYLNIYFKDVIHTNLSDIKIKNDNKIFVSIASYRDIQCSYTLQNIINMAKNPSNLVIAIFQQNDSSDKECVFDSIDLKGSTIKIIKCSNVEARGPCWARFILQQLWSGEEYFLQIDSHTRFVQDWDKLSIAELNKSPNIKTCLTNYVSLYNLQTGTCDNNPLRNSLYIAEIDQDDGFFRYNSHFVDFIEKLPISKGWSGCFSFSRSNILHDAPYDPYTPFLFFGEEMDIHARLFTRGWDVYAPTIPICFTVFDRSYRHTFWEHPDQQNVSYLSKLRLYYRFGLIKDGVPKEVLKDMDKYSLGNEKTFEEFMTFCLS